MPEGGGVAFDACVRTPFATLGITTTSSHVTGIRFLAPGTPARPPRARRVRLRTSKPASSSGAT